jgi:phage shock protein PspC (stress-responsive transcriptional regulator)
MATTAEVKRLHKSRTERMLDGVCGGIAEYFALDPTLVRIAWVLLTLFGGSGIILYIVAMIIMPAAPITPAVPLRPRNSGNNTRFWGILLVVAGSVWLLGNIGVPLWHGWWTFSWDIGLAVLLILAGVAFLFGGRSYVSAPRPANAEPGAEVPPAGAPEADGDGGQARRLHRSRKDRKLFGVCGGLGEYFGIDGTIVRLLFVAAVIASVGVAVVAYVVMAILVPDEVLIPHTT